MAKGHRDPVREQHWRERVLAWASSGLSMRAFCDQHQLTETTFQYWRRELRDRDVAACLSSPAPPRFVPVTVCPPVVPAIGSVEVRCPSGHVVILASFDAASLSNLFAALAPLAGEASTC